MKGIGIEHWTFGHLFCPQDIHKQKSNIFIQKWRFMVLFYIIQSLEYWGPIKECIFEYLFLLRQLAMSTDGSEDLRRKPLSERFINVQKWHLIVLFLHHSELGILRSHYGVYFRISCSCGNLECQWMGLKTLGESP